MEARKIPVLTDAQKKDVIESLELGMHVYLHRTKLEFFLQNGETHEFIRDRFETEEEEALHAEWASDPSAFLVVRAPNSYDTYGWMKEFASRGAPAAVQDALLDRLSHRRPFASFLDYLHNGAPASVLNLWTQFLAKQMAAHLSYELQSYDNREEAFDLEDDDEEEEEESRGNDHEEDEDPHDHELNDHELSDDEIDDDAHF
jgi:hypothetical protein